MPDYPATKDLVPFEANRPGDRTGLEVLESLPEWMLVAEMEELRLYRRA
jgi:hypothetical protein